MNSKQTDVLILGGGVIGLVSALELLRAGRSVTVIERATAGSGASHGNCGTITPSHAPPLAMPGMIGKALGWMLQPDAPFYVKPSLNPALWAWLLQVARRCNWEEFKRHTRVKGELLMRSRELLAELISGQKLECEFEQRGTLYVFRSLQDFEATQWLPQALNEVDIPCESLDGAEARRREPALNDSIVAAFFNPRDAELRPNLYAAELARRVRELGGEIREGVTVEGFRRERGAIDSVQTSAGEIRAREIVLALGSWSPLLARQLELKLPIQPGKGYSITYERPVLSPRIPLVLKERSVCVTAWSSGYRLGSTMEFAGYDESLNRRRLDALTRAAGEYLHEPVGPKVQEEWYGWRPMTYDDLPIIGRTAALSNLVIATGHGMLGVSLSSVTGRLVREIVCGENPIVDPAPYSPDRF
jgi:D-amino-acid dehydrogenase